MKFSLFTLLRLVFVVCAYFLFVSCSKDADLLSDYVVTDTDDISQTYALLVNDTYFSDMNTSVVLDVLSNDNLTNLENVTIVETSTPTFGSVVINEDNTLTYTPPIPVANESETVTVVNESETVTVETETATTETETVTTETETATTETETITTEEEVVDTFVYITEETSEEGEVTTAEATVTVTMSNIESKYPTTGPNVFYVSTSGVSTNNGKTESTAWDISHSFKTAKAGDIIHIKAGNYGNKNLIVGNSGTSDNPIRFIGYTNSPSDLVSDKGSTFAYGESLSANKMPLLRSTDKGKGTAIINFKKYIKIENLQITEYGTAVSTNSDAHYLSLTNIIGTNLGNQNTNDYDGKGFIIKGENSSIKNSFILNANAEAIMLRNANNSTISYTKVYGDNPTNPTDYYFLITETNNAIIENSHAERAEGLSHGGHGFDIKEVGEYNTIRNCTVIGTSLEVNFAGVKNNLFENIEMYGYGTNPGNYATVIAIISGANHNTFRNIYMSKIYKAINAMDQKDGVSSPFDEVSCGYDNTFENMIINDCDRFIEASVHSSAGGDHATAKAERFTFKNITLYNVKQLYTAYSDMVDFEFQNIGIHTHLHSTFHNGPGQMVRPIYRNSAYYNSNATMPSGWSATDNPMFKSLPTPGQGGPEDFKLLDDSPWLNLGISLDFF